jgi:four helix bundle protein
MNGHRRLAVWRQSQVLVQLIYRLTRQLPSEEKFVALLQMRRAAWSVHNNIAESNAKRGRAELRRFLDSSIGSLAEIDAMLDTLGTLYDLDRALCAEIEAPRRTINAGLFALLRGRGRGQAGAPAAPAAPAASAAPAAPTAPAATRLRSGPRSSNE